MNQKKQKDTHHVALQKRREKSGAVESKFLTGNSVVIVPFDASQVQRCKVVQVHTYDMTIDHDTEQQKLHKLDCAMAIKQEHAKGIQQHLQMHKETHALSLPRPTRRDVQEKGLKIHEFRPKATGRITLRCGISFMCKVLQNRSFIYIVEVAGMQVLVWKHAIHSIEQERKKK